MEVHSFLRIIIFVFVLFPSIHAADGTAKRITEKVSGPAAPPKTFSLEEEIIAVGKRPVTSKASLDEKEVFSFLSKGKEFETEKLPSTIVTKINEFLPECTTFTEAFKRIARLRTVSKTFRDNLSDAGIITYLLGEGYALYNPEAHFEDFFIYTAVSEGAINTARVALKYMPETLDYGRVTPKSLYFYAAGFGKGMRVNQLKPRSTISVKGIKALAKAKEPGINAQWRPFPTSEEVYIPLFIALTEAPTSDEIRALLEAGADVRQTPFQRLIAEMYISPKARLPYDFPSNKFFPDKLDWSDKRELWDEGIKKEEDNFRKIILHLKKFGGNVLTPDSNGKTALTYVEEKISQAENKVREKDSEMKARRATYDDVRNQEIVLEEKPPFGTNESLISLKAKRRILTELASSKKFNPSGGAGGGAGASFSPKTGARPAHGGAGHESDSD